jgi:replicative DNA helicase
LANASNEGINWVQLGVYDSLTLAIMYTRLREHLWPAFEEIERAQASETMSGIGSGFPDLDSILAGWHPGDLVVLGGATGMGKSALAFQLAVAATLRKNHGAVSGRVCGVVLLEMPPERCVLRMVCCEARVDTARLARGQLLDPEYARLATVAGYINSAPMYFIHSPRLTVSEMCRAAGELKAAEGLDLLVVDTLNLLRVPGFAPPATNREQEVGIIVRELKALALDLQVPVIATASLSRGVEQRHAKRPVLSDLRDSGDIENTADIVAFVYRPEYYFGPVNKDGNSIEALAELIIAKNRYGATGTVPLIFLKEFGRFEPNPEPGY